MGRLQRSELYVGVPGSTNRGTDRKTGERCASRWAGYSGPWSSPQRSRPRSALSLALALFGILSPTAAQAATPAVYIWGHGPAKAQEFQYPTAIQGLPSGIVAVQAGNWGGMAIDSQGNVWDWGSNGDGELGNGRATKTNWLDAVEAKGPTHVVSIGEGNSFAAAVDSHGGLWVWGNDNFGELCLNKRGRNVTRPVKVPGVDATAVSGGGYHLLVLLANGTVGTCGINQFGQLGDGNFRVSAKLVAVKNLTHVTAVSSGDLFSSALEADGSIWTWGYNPYGQLGNGTTKNEDVPQKVTLPAPASVVYAGGDFPDDGHMMALLSNGTTVAWGDNAWGQQGVGTTGGIYTTAHPVKMPTGVTFTTVAAGGVDSYGIDQAGNLWAWGGRSGELGNGLDSHVPLPEKVGKGFTAISATATETVGLSTGP